MFYTFPAPCMVSPSRATKLFDLLPRENVSDSSPVFIAEKYMGGDITNHIVDAETSAFGSDYCYNLYYAYNKQSGEGEEDEYLVRGIMTPHVNPYLLIELEDHIGKRAAVYEPINASFNGDIIWKYKFGKEDSLTASYSELAEEMLLSDFWISAPATVRGNTESQVLPSNQESYFYFQKTEGGDAPLKLVWTHYIEDAYIPDNRLCAFQYPWDKAEWKQENLSAIQEWNSTHHDWTDWVPESEVQHGMCGAKYAYAAEVKPVDSFKTNVANSSVMTFEPVGDGYGNLKSFRGYFFYPLLYLDPNDSGTFNKIPFSDDFPTNIGTDYRSYELYPTSNNYGVSLTYELQHAKSKKTFGTPVWSLTFDADCPFSADIDPERFYFVALETDGTPLTINYTSTTSASEYYYKRRPINYNAFFWSEAKEDFRNGTFGKDTREETFLSVGLDQEHGFGGVTRNFTFGPLTFKSTAYNAVYKTQTCPRRRSGARADEWVPDPETPYKGGGITMLWYENAKNITWFCVQDGKIEDVKKQQILDAADMRIGVFQVLESRVEPQLESSE